MTVTNILHLWFSIAELLLDNLIASKLLEEGLKDDLRIAMTSPHTYQHTKRRRASQADIDNAPFLRRISMRRSQASIKARGRFTFNAENGNISAIKLRVINYSSRSIG